VDSTDPFVWHQRSRHETPSLIVVVFNTFHHGTWIPKDFSNVIYDISMRINPLREVLLQLV